MSKKKIILIIIILIILLLILNLCINFKILKSTLLGFWSGCEIFCEKNNIDLFWLYISDKLAWIMIKKNNKDVINKLTNYKYNNSVESLFFIDINNKKKYNGKIKFKDLNNQQIPNNLNFKLYPFFGRLILYDNQFVYGDLYKNNKLTKKALQIYETKKNKLDVDFLLN